MSAAVLESTLARLYTDAEFRAQFLADPATALEQADLTTAERAAIINIDRDGLALAAASYARKRAAVARTRSQQRGWLALAQRVARVRWR